MQLEVQDPRNSSTVCLASVIDTRGPRLKLRLDGGYCDGFDFWRLIDSSDIHALGFSEGMGEMIQPPLGNSC